MTLSPTKRDKIETRADRRPVEFRANLQPDSDSPGTITGYAAVFGQTSQDIGNGWVETVAPGAFTKTLKDGARVVARFNHDDNQLLGSTDGQTLTVAVDSTGLMYTCELPNTGAGRDVAELASRGDLHSSSFAFIAVKEAWDLTVDPAVRTLQEVQLIDVSPVVSPAYTDTTVALRSLEAAREQAAMLLAQAIESESTTEVEQRELTTLDSETTTADTTIEETRAVEPLTHSTIPVELWRRKLELDSLR